MKGMSFIQRLWVIPCLVMAATVVSAAEPSLAGLEGKRVGVLEGSVNGEPLHSHIASFTMLYFMTANDLLGALQSGNVDAVVADIPFLAMYAAVNPQVVLIREKIQDGNYALATHKENAQLNDRVSAILREFNQDGTLKRLHAKWFTAPEAERVLPDIPGAGGNVLRYGVAEIGKPFVYQDKDGKLIGYDIELGMLIAQKLGMKFHPQEFLFAHLLPAINNNLIDIAGSGIIVTPDRGEEVKFTAPYFRSGSAAMVRR